MKKKIYDILLTAAIMMLLICTVSLQACAKEETKIHFISLNGLTDAILLESNGHYGLVDSGEDWDYPDGVTYPLRYGIAVNEGYEQQVIHYLEQLGVEKLDFYIATHSHSDHIGSGDEILRHFPIEKLYISEYDDSYLLDAHGNDPGDPYYIADANEDNLWDNQYVYDNLISEAEAQGTQIITDLDLEINADKRIFYMGEMTIELMNYEKLRDENGNIVPVASENSNSLVTKVTAFGEVALLTSDLEPSDGDNTKIALQLIEQLYDTKGNNEKTPDLSGLNTEGGTQDIDYGRVELPDQSSEEISGIIQGYREELLSEFPQFGSDAFADDSQPNKGKTISIDLMKMCHHSLDYNNPTFFLTSLNPKNVVITGSIERYSDRQKACLPYADAYATNSDSAAVVATFSGTGLEIDYVQTKPEWAEIDGDWYYFDENGRTLSQGVKEIDDSLYYMNRQGATVSGWITDESNTYYADSEDNVLCTGWVEIDDKLFYFDRTGALVRNKMIDDKYVGEDGAWVEDYIPSGWLYIEENWYYYNENGEMLTGWQKVGNTWYYMYEDGKMAADTWIGNYYVNKSGAWVQGAVTYKWMSSNGRWWLKYSDGSYAKSTWKLIDNIWYYFDASGWMATGWKSIGGNWYYFQSSGEMQGEGWHHISGKWYCFDKSGRMYSGWLEKNGNWYYLGGDGAMRTGWQYINGNYYYLYSSGVMARSTRIDGFYLDESGIWIP